MDIEPHNSLSNNKLARQENLVCLTISIFEMYVILLNALDPLVWAVCERWDSNPHTEVLVPKALFIALRQSTVHKK